MRINMKRKQLIKVIRPMCPPSLFLSNFQGQYSFRCHEGRLQEGPVLSVGPPHHCSKVTQLQKLLWGIKIVKTVAINLLTSIDPY
ncbi:hypothetical protein E2C01_037002 [Portunus trituberculatus]|uniref:Uncharacterized protein n=1 Tax=Portunus trituberculatus TaxID=210409 RepID=A0A5B7FCS4_PORTR|nr:hypothetical protein [Portunus trituberculatus]